MNQHTTRICSLQDRALTALVLLVVLLSTGGCGGGGAVAAPTAAPAAAAPAEAYPTQAAKPGGSDWDVQRYKTFDKVWASLNSVNTLERVYASYSTWKKLYTNGYVTTSKSGQAKLRRGSCYAYVYQKSQYAYSEVVKSLCEKGGGNCCSTFQNCTAVVVTLPATVTFKGTMVTVIELVDEETTVVITHEGVAEVTYTEPTQRPGATVTVPAGYAAHFSTSKWEEWAKTQFNSEPGTPFPISGPLIDVLAQLGLLPQIRRVNAVLASEGLPLVPDPGPPFLNAVIINEGFADGRVAMALATGANWGTIVDEVYPGQNVWPALFYTPDEAIALRDQTYSQENAKNLLAEAGYYSPPLAIIIWYNADTAGLNQVASSLAKEFDNVGIKSELQSFSDGSVESEKTFQGDYQADVVQLVLQLEQPLKP